MSADLSLRLRSLTQDYHDGRLNFAAYRSMRGALLDSLVSGAMGAANAAAAAAVAVTQPRAGGWQQHSDEITRPGKPRAASGGGDELPREHRSGAFAGSQADAAPARETAADGAAGVQGKRSTPMRAIRVGVVVLALAGLGAWWWLAPQSPGAGGTSTMPTAAEQGRIHSLLTQFTDRGDWSDTHLATLNADLLELGGAQLSASADEAWFQRFVDEIRRRLKEQQALASTPLSADNSPLAALAITVGLDLNAPDAAIHIAALPPPRATESEAVPRPSAMKVAATPGAEHAPATTPTVEDDKTSSPAKVSASLAAAAPVGANDHPAAKSGVTLASAATPASAEAPTHEGACRSDLIGTRRPFCHDMLPAGVEGPPLALVPAGAFDMGSTVAAEEQPVHRVTIRAPFAISVYEVSQAEFKEFCSQPDRACPKQPWSGDDYPMVNVTWDEARAYTAWLSSVTHQRYSLPSEAQWEYAARAGRTGLFPSGDQLSPTDAHYSMLAKQTTAVRRSQKFNANAFRLLHTVGNVREWVEDAWAPSFAGAPSDGTATTAATSQSAQRVARGGSYADGAARLRISLREGLPAGTRDAMTGFRIVRELP